MNIVQLEQKMVETFGFELDVFSHQSEVLVDKVTDILNLHSYFFSSLFKGFLLGFLGFLVFGFSLFTFGSSILMGIVLSLFGLVPFTFLSFVQGLVNFVNRLRDDISEILALLLEMVESILSELQQEATNTVSSIPAISQIFSNLIIFGIIPAVAQIIRKRIPILGGFISGLIRFILKKMEILLKKRVECLAIESGHLQKLDQSQQEVVKTIDESLSEYHQTSLRFLSTIKENSQNIVDELFGLVLQSFKKWQLFAYILVVGYITFSLVITL